MSGVDEVGKRIIAKLNDLGDDADEVAGTLRLGGIRGICGFPDACPVFNYLTDALSDIQMRFVDALTAEWLDSDLLIHEVDVPPAVSDFIAAFDTGSYPELAEAVPERIASPYDVLAAE